MTTAPDSEQLGDRVELDDADRLGRGHDPPPALPVRATLQPFSRGERPPPPVVDRADELGGRGERRVVGGDERLGDQREHGLADAGVGQRLGEPVADHPLGLGDERVERVGAASARVRAALQRQQATCGPLPWQTSSSCSGRAAPGRAAAAGRGPAAGRRRAARRGGAARCRRARRRSARQPADRSDAWTVPSGETSSRVLGTTTTGSTAWCTTSVLVDPIIRRVHMPAPRAPTTSSAAPSAASSRTWLGRPRHTILFLDVHGRSGPPRWPPCPPPP